MSSNDYPFARMPDEEVLLEARPHPLSMLGLMSFWMALGALGVIYIVYYSELTEMARKAVKYQALGFVADHAYGALWVASILVPLVVMAVFRINVKYVLVLILILAARAFIWWKGRQMLGLPENPHPHLENYMLIAIGVIGVIGVELFRRGHRYYLTDSRIVARFGSIGKSERSTLYSKIDDLLLQQGLLGRILNFGTVIPITSTGLGMGQDMAIAGAGIGGGKAGIGANLFAAGAKAQNVPRELSIYVLYKIHDPEYARNLIFQEMQARERPRNNSFQDFEDDDLD